MVGLLRPNMLCGPMLCDIIIVNKGRSLELPGLWRDPSHWLGSLQDSPQPVLAGRLLLYERNACAGLILERSHTHACPLGHTYSTRQSQQPLQHLPGSESYVDEMLSLVRCSNCPSSECWQCSMTLQQSWLWQPKPDTNYRYLSHLFELYSPLLRGVSSKFTTWTKGLRT